MARLDRNSRHRLAVLLRKRLPRHWRVSVGDRPREVYVEVDQDGRSQAAVGSTVIVLENSPDGVAVFPCLRVPLPPDSAYVEAREPYAEAPLIVGGGWGWRERATDLVVLYALAADTALLAAAIKHPAEA